MRKIRTSGSMSGEGKRSDAKWPKPPRLSSTLLRTSEIDAGFYWRIIYLLTTNKGKTGQAIALKWRLRDGDSNLVTDTSEVIGRVG